MKRGIYIMVNDRVIDNAIALINSIQVHDAETPIIMIPYDNHYRIAARILKRLYGIRIYEDLCFIERLSNRLRQIFGDRFFARPNQFRKQACWFGPFDEFLYIDSDIVIFEKIIENLTYLSNSDFIHCDDQYLSGMKYVFTDKIIKDNVFSEDDLNGIFNCGFWGSKKNLISEKDLYETLKECASHIEYFNFSHKTSDLPIINYMILKRISRRFNIFHKSDGEPEIWAGNSHFKYQNNRLIDPNVNQPLKYLHWAGIRIEPGCPYWDIWRHYRHLHTPNINQTFDIQRFKIKSFYNRVKRRLLRTLNLVLKKSFIYSKRD